MEIQFKNWIESVEANRAGIEDTILGFLRSKLKITDDQSLLSLPLGSMDKNVVHDLINRGIISGADESVLTDIKNGNITVSGLIDRLSGKQGELPSSTYRTNPSGGF